MDKRKIILDCDPGHDDAVAIMLAAKSPQIDLLGITVVAGNQTLEKTTANALNVCQYLGLDIPVYAGCGQPMIRDKQVIADDIHGETGLDGPVFAPLRKKAEDKHAVLYIIDTLMASDGDITLVPTGPLTNIAMAIRLEPRILPKIREIVLMGGCYQLVFQQEPKSCIRMGGRASPRPSDHSIPDRPGRPYYESNVYGNRHPQRSKLWPYEL